VMYTTYYQYWCLLYCWLNFFICIAECSIWFNPFHFTDPDACWFFV